MFCTCPADIASFNTFIHCSSLLHRVIWFPRWLNSISSNAGNVNENDVQHASNYSALHRCARSHSFCFTTGTMAEHHSIASVTATMTPVSFFVHVWGWNATRGGQTYTVTFFIYTFITNCFLFNFTFRLTWRLVAQLLYIYISWYSPIHYV